MRNIHWSNMKKFYGFLSVILSSKSMKTFLLKDGWILITNKYEGGARLSSPSYQDIRRKAH
jgi:hypothetical protein